MHKKFILYFLFLLSASLYSQDKRAIDSLITITKNAQYDTTKARAFCLLCYEYSTSDSILSKQYADKGIELAKKINFQEATAQCLYNLSQLYFEKSDYISSIDCLQKAIAIRKKLGDTKRQGNGTRDLGTCYLKLGKYDLSLKYYIEALQLFESIDSKNSIYNTNCAIAEVYYLDGNYIEAIKQLENALKISKEINDSLYISNAYMNLGLLHGENNQFEKGLSYLKESLKICEKLNQKETLEGIFLNLGLLYAKVGDNKNAILYYEKCLKIAREENIEEDIAIVLSNLSQLNIKMGNYDLAIKLGEQSLELSKKIKLKDKIKDATENLAEAHSKLGNFEKAFMYQKINSDMKDSLYNEDRQTTIAEIQTKYDTEKKDNEIKLLNKDKELQDAELQKNQTQRTALIIGFSLAILLVVFIFRGFKQKQKANLLLEEKNTTIETQKKMVEVKNKEILDSINYAQLIQQAVLPSAAELTSHLQDGFVLFSPKDIVSGDFYWVTGIDDFTFFSTVDCTGHGVPGGFMSMLGCSLLNEVINEKKILEPADVLDMMRIKLITSLKQQGNSGENKDGMDMTLCRLNKSRTELVYAAANNPLWLIRNQNIIEYPADKQPVGISTDHAKQFTQQKISLQKGDYIYIFTDGYADQFGGPKGKKFKYKALQQLLLKHTQKTMDEQKEVLKSYIENWRGDLEQVDDILIIGIKI